MYGEILCDLLEAAVDNMPSPKKAVPLRYKTIAIDLGRQMGHTYAAKQFHDNNSERYDTVIVCSYNNFEYNSDYKITTLINFIDFFRGYRTLASESHELVIIYDRCAPFKHDDTTYALLAAIPNLRAIINLQ